jgi:hypothetical protein
MLLLLPLLLLSVLTDAPVTGSAIQAVAAAVAAAAAAVVSAHRCS